MTTRRPTPNTTAAGAGAGACGTPWLDHFEPPLGTARGCEACDSLGLTVRSTKGRRITRTVTADQATQDRLFDLGKGDA